MRWLVSLLFALMAVTVVGAQTPVPFADDDGMFIEVDGLQTYMLQRGPDDGPPVLLLHGFLGSTFDWRFNMDELAAAGFRVIAFDRPPYGLSAKPDDYDFSHAQQAEFTVKLMDELGIDRAALMGYSIGANTLMHLALNHPERVDRLVVIAGTILTEGGLPPAITRVASSPAFAPLLTNTLRSLPDMVGEEVMSAEVAERYLALWDYPGWEDALVNVIKTATGNLLAEEQLQTINIPILIIWGEDDTLLPVADGERLVELLPNAIWKLYPGVGHLVMSEMPGQFNTDVIEFLEELNP